MVVDPTRSTSSSGGKLVAARRRASPTTSACAPSSSASSRRSAGASTSRRRSSTRASRTARASTPSSGRSRSRGSCITIRKFSKVAPHARQARRLRLAHRADGAFLRAASIAKKNIVISGGTGTGKTTLLNVLSAAIPADERIVTIEDAAELQLRSRTSCRSRRRPPNMEGKGEFTIRDLVEERAPHAPRPHRRRRVPRRRGARHAPGDEHRPRRLAHDDARELAARGDRAPGDARAHGRRRLPLARDPRADRREHRPRRPADAPLRRNAQASRRSPRSSASSDEGEMELRPIFEFVRTSDRPERPGLRRLPRDRVSAVVSSIKFIVMSLVRPGEPYL